MNEPSGLARLALVHLERTTRLGVPRETLLREARLDERQLRDPDSRIPLAAVARLWRAVTSHVSDPALGLRIGTDARAREWGLVGYTMAFSSTVGSALKRLAHYSRIVSDALVVTLDTEGDATWLRLDVQPALRAFRPAVDARLAAVLSICREIAAAPIAPLTVQLPYRRPADVKDYETFFAAPLEFGALATALLLRNDDLARPVAVGRHRHGDRRRRRHPRGPGRRCHRVRPRVRRGGRRRVPRAAAAHARPPGTEGAGHRLGTGGRQRRPRVGTWL